MSNTVKQLRTTQDGLAVTWDSGETATYSWFWLRDHGEDSNSQNLKTRQRRIDTFSIDSAVRVQSVSMSSDNSSVNLQWTPTEASHVSVQRLAECIGQPKLPIERMLWRDAEAIEPMPRIDYPHIQDSENGVFDWLKLIHRWGFAIVDKVPATEEGTVNLAERIGQAQQTIFGNYWRLSTEITEHEDTAYTTMFLSPHTDATYYHDAPGLQMFNCLEFAGQGGESVLVDGYAIAADMAQRHPSWYELLCRISVPGQYIEPGVHLTAERPVFRLNRFGELIQVSFNNYDRAPFVLPPLEMEAFYQAYREFNRLSSDQARWTKIPLRPGMALIFDNWRCLHGRMAYSGKRVFYGCYHARALYESRIRSLSKSPVAVAA